MTEPEFTAALNSGKVQSDDASAEPTGGAPLPVQQSVSLEQFLPILLQLQSTQRYLTAAPTFVPQTFQDQIQFVYTGGVYSLYLYFNNQWNQFSAGGGGGGSINGLSNAPSGNLASGTPTTVQFSTNVFANGITWDGTNYWFLIVTAGQYIIVGRANYSSSVAASNVNASIFINGVSIADDAVYAVAGNHIVNNEVTTLANLSVGDKVTLVVSQNSGFTTNFAEAYLGIAKV